MLRGLSQLRARLEPKATCGCPGEAPWDRQHAGHSARGILHLATPLDNLDTAAMRFALYIDRFDVHGFGPRLFTPTKQGQLIYNQAPASGLGLGAVCLARSPFTGGARACS